jgi:N-acetylmuramoyl-L-alanine amidase
MKSAGASTGISVCGGSMSLLTRVASVGLIALAAVVSAYAAPQGDIARIRSEYLRLRNIDATGDDPIHRSAWESIASRIRGIVVQRPVGEDTAALRLIGAETHLRLYRTGKQQAYLTTAKALVAPLTPERSRDIGILNIETLGIETRSQALVLAGDVALYSGTLDAAQQFYGQALALGATNGELVAGRLQGLRNGTYARFLPSPDREIPRLIRAREARARGGSGPIVVLDPGHGGGDFGATSPIGGDEKEITLDIARRVKALLERRHQVKVQLTREDDTFVPLARRTAFANRKDGAVFVSLHVNASEKHDASGFEAYYLDNTNDEASRKLAERENGIVPGEGVDDLSFMLSDLIQSGKIEDSIFLTRAIESGVRWKVIVPHKDLRSLGVKKAPFFVLVGAHMPCALIEMFFVDHPSDGRKLRDDSFRSALAAGVADGIARFLTNDDTTRR